MLLKPHYERKIMDKTTIIKTLRDMAKHPTVTLPRDTDALKAAADLLEQPEPKPVECHTCKGLGRIYMGCGSWIHCDTCNTTGKATTPPKREWVGLTDEEIKPLCDENHIIYGAYTIDFIQAIEAKLKEKNT